MPMHGPLNPAKVPSDHHGKADPELTYSPWTLQGQDWEGLFLFSGGTDSPCANPDGCFFSLSLETASDGDP